MLIALHIQLRRRRRLVVAAMAALALALAAVTAHRAFMTGPMDGHAMSDVAAMCLVLGGSLAIAGLAVFVPLRPARWPLWVILAPQVPEPPLLAAPVSFLVRAGPPPLLQVFRL